MKKLVVKAVIESIPTVTDFVDKILEEHSCDMKAKIQIDIAIDEILGNISQYAYETDNGDVSVSVQVEEAPKRAIITFADSGVPYNPITTEEPDTSLSAEERKIGGLGIFMVKKTMDDMAYEYTNNCNILRITKNI